MADPLLGEIKIFAGNFAPRGWALCDGQLLSISQNSALFSLLGTIYGGDGRTSFGLPDLRGRLPIHQGQGAGLSARQLGQSGGEEQTTLTVGHLPSHNHGAWTHAFDGLNDEPEGHNFARNVAGLPMYANFDREGSYVQLKQSNQFECWRRAGSFKFATLPGSQFYYSTDGYFSFKRLERVYIQQEGRLFAYFK